MIRTNFVGALAAAFAIAALACNGDDLSGPTTGTLSVTTASRGTEPDADGYTIQVDAEQPRTIGPAATLQSPDLTPGNHVVLLAGTAANCAVSGENPRTVNIRAGETTTASFQVTCSATTGSLQITIVTTGESLDADGYLVTLDDTGPQPIGTNTTLTISGLTGDHQVELSGVATNCRIDGDNPSQVTRSQAKERRQRS